MDTISDATGKPRTLKIKEFCETSSKFYDLTLFCSSCLRDPISDPLGLNFGSFLAPKMAETLLGILLGAAKSRSRGLSSSPKVQERSRRCSGPRQEASMRPRRCKRPLGTDFHPSGTCLGAILGQLWDPILEQFWDNVGTMLGPPKDPSDSIS